jgi:hypothetical protein
MIKLLDDEALEPLVIASNSIINTGIFSEFKNSDNYTNF